MFPVRYTFHFLGQGEAFLSMEVSEKCSLWLLTEGSLSGVTGKCLNHDTFSRFFHAFSEALVCSLLMTLAAFLTELLVEVMSGIAEFTELVFPPFSQGV